MKVLKWCKENIKEVAYQFGTGKVVVLPSDTLYGLMAVALNRLGVERVYKIKGRRPDKPCIILISSIDDLKQFGVRPTDWQYAQLKKYWPGKVSIVLECHSPKLGYLHRGTETLAFRLPDKELLRELVELTGPLIAPSANPENSTPALTVSEAQKYFGDELEIYVDGGELNSPPSTVISLVGDKLEVIRGKM